MAVRKSAKTVVDFAGTKVMDLGRLEADIPNPRAWGAGSSPLELQVDTAWLSKQRCPQHGFKFTHYRARWAKHPYLLQADRPAVHFLCPIGHAWQVVIVNPEG